MSTYLLLPLFPTAILVCVLWPHLFNTTWYRKMCGFRRKPLDTIDLRLKSYAILAERTKHSTTDDTAKNQPTNPKIPKDKQYVPSRADKFAILLGSLKKIEGKNAILLTVIVFFETLLFAAQPDKSSEQNSVPKFQLESCELTVLALFLAPALFAALIGNRHLDNFHLLWHKKTDCEEVLYKALQNDLLLKERLFKIAWWTTFVTAAYFFGSIFMQAL